MRGVSAFGYEPGDTPPTAIAGCDSVMVGMQELNNLLEQAFAAGLQDHPAVKQAVNVYDANTDWSSRIWIFIPLTSQCETRTNEVRQAVKNLVQVIEERTGKRPDMMRPDYVPPSTSTSGIPVWGYALIGVVGVVAVAYTVGQGAVIARLWKSPKRLHGRRR